MRRPPSSYTHGKSERRQKPGVEKAAAEALAKLGKRLKYLRGNRCGLSQDEAAERAGLHPNALSRIESGKQNVTLLTLVALALAYGVTVEALFDRKVKAISPDDWHRATSVRRR